MEEGWFFCLVNYFFAGVAICVGFLFLSVDLFSVYQILIFIKMPRHFKEFKMPLEEKEAHSTTDPSTDLTAGKGFFLTFPPNKQFASRWNLMFVFLCCSLSW
ncbi:hypothetical protein ILYODFUR_035997 [Ilyodon furcidens]|uniref:Uncharacterized protein n=1 Tax=Ilyodon furcidens TaxID=33524 RepID=A0ABV0U2A7_9TELE